MFSALPPYKAFKTDSYPKSVALAFEIFHGKASEPTYRSLGKMRKSESHCIFHYTVSGHGEVMRLGKRYRTSAGEGFFNIISEENSGYFYPENESEPWEFVVICFDGGNTRQIVSELLENQTVYSLKSEDAVFAKMCAELSKREFASLTFLSELISLILEKQGRASDVVEKFNEIARRTLSKNPTVSFIADEMGISREHLERTYTRLACESPAKYIKRKRFEMLCVLLGTDKKLSEIADVMSFPSVSGMGVFFKRISGITISKYKANGYLHV